MYLDYYKLKEKPFSIVPDSTFIYNSREHLEARNHLLYGIKSNEGFLLLTGGIGTGKTTLCRELMHELKEKIETAFIFNPPSTPVELIKTILHDLGLDSSASSKKELLDELNSYLLKCASEGKRVIAIIDEAQHLSQEVLEEIRLLSNLETEKEKLLQIILSGQEELLEKLSSHCLRQLYQRISIQYRLKPLNGEEVDSYIRYRLLKAGSKGDIDFTRRAVRKIFRDSQGIPRMINLICDKALLAGYVAQKKKITEKMVKEAANNTCCRHVLPAPPLLKLSYSIMGLVIIGLIAAGYLTGAWSRFMGGDGTSATDCFATVYDHSPLIKEQGLLANEALSSNPSQKKVPLLSDKQAIPKTTQFDTNGVMICKNNLGCAPEALATILRIWHVPEDILASIISQWKAGSTFSFHDHAKAFNLRVTMTRDSIKNLAAANYPCIIPIHEGNYRYAVLSGIHEDQVTLLDPKKGKRILSKLELQNIWSGKAFYIWKDFDTLPIDLQKGDIHNVVITLKKRLYLLGYNIPSPLTNLFDEGLDMAVKKFQLKSGIVADGIIGVQTKLAFYRAFYPDLTPELGS